MPGVDAGSIGRGLCRTLLAAALLALPPGLALAAPAGTVVGVVGGCFVESGGSRGPAKIGLPVQVGDTVDVAADGKLKLRMADGSVVSAAAGTRMTVTAFGVDGAGQRQEARLSLAQGLLRAVVAPVGRPASFEVDTAVGAAAVRSTDWFIEAKPHAAVVAVIEGGVVLTGRALGRQVVVPAGAGSRVDAGHDPRTPHALPPAAFLALIAKTNIETRLGLCQCIANHAILQASCKESVAACQAACAGVTYSFTPLASYSCAEAR